MFADSHYVIDLIVVIVVDVLVLVMVVMVVVVCGGELDMWVFFPLY